LRIHFFKDLSRHASHHLEHFQQTLPQALRAFSKKAAEKNVGPILGVEYSKMTIGVPKETFPLERRVSQTPESVQKLIEAGFNVKVW
jgi:hypothetical protein